MEMEKRIRIVWCLTIVTILLLWGLQAYWIYNQYRYQLEEKTQYTYKLCTRLIQQEEDIRRQSCKKEVPENEKSVNNDSLALRTAFRYELSFKKDIQKTKLIVYLYKGNLPDQRKMKEYELEGVTSDDIIPLLNRARLSEYRLFSSAIMDSLLKSNGYKSAQNYRFFYTRKFSMKPSYSRAGGLSPTIQVIYPFNSLLHQSVSFLVPISFQGILKEMFWQLCGCLVLMVVLIICFVAQIKTILVQKRIDGIRRTFLKNMIYEMKQPKAEGGCAEEKPVAIGHMEFYYSLNELRMGGERVIMTSRQSEILQILAASQNKLVLREEILNKEWGDDSYSNSLALNVQITYLRRALKADEKVSIEAIMKKGYLLRTAPLQGGDAEY